MREKENVRERREKVRARERSPWRERECMCTGRKRVYRGRGFKSETRGSQTRRCHKRGVRDSRLSHNIEERGRGRGFRVALTREEHRRGHELRVVLI